MAPAVVLFRLGHDPSLGLVRRFLARVLSFYQRAPIHFLAEVGWGELDWMLSSLVRWLLLRLCARRARYWRAQASIALPSSGWSGSLFVLTLWLGLVLAIARFLPL